MASSKPERDEFERLYSLELWSSGRLAKRYGVAVNTIAKWRRAWGIKPNGIPAQRMEDVSKLELIECVNKGYDDARTGVMLRVSALGIRNLRRKYDIQLRR